MEQTAEPTTLWPHVLKVTNCPLLYQGSEETFEDFWKEARQDIKKQRREGSLNFPDFWRNFQITDGLPVANKTFLSADEKAETAKQEAFGGESKSSLFPKDKLFQYIKTFCYVRTLDPDCDIRRFENPFFLQNSEARAADNPDFQDRFQDLKNELALTACELTIEKFFPDPIFIMDFPLSLSPLTKSLRQSAAGSEGPRSRLVERFEPYIAGMEIGNAYTELNDPEEQEARLREQRRKAEGAEGAFEAHPVDENFLHALRTGFPPAGGVGLGLERLIMILTDQKNIRDSILFPVLKSQEPQSAET